MFPARPTIVFSSGRSWFQRLVQAVSLSEVDHVAIGLGNQLLHAIEHGVVVHPRSEWFITHGNKHLAEYEIVPDVSRNVLACLDRVGEPYDRLGVVRVGLGLALRRSMSLVRPWPATSQAHTCAAFAMMIDPWGDLIPEWSCIARRDVVPSDLYAAIGPSFSRIMQPMHQL